MKKYYFIANGIKLRVKIKDCKIKIKVLNLYTSEDGLDYECNYFNGLENENFSIQLSNYSLIIKDNKLIVSHEQPKIKYRFSTKYECADWFNKLFTLEGDE